MLIAMYLKTKKNLLRECLLYAHYSILYLKKIYIKCTIYFYIIYYLQKKSLYVFKKKSRKFRFWGYATTRNSLISR